MSNLQIREVDFNGDKLLAVQQKDTGKIYVGNNWVCKGLGFTKGSIDRQVKKIQSDLVLSKGASKMTLDTNGIMNDVLTIELDFLPLWLAKINANIIQDEKIQEKLVEYQLKAKDVLASAFLPPSISPQANQSITQLPQTFQEALRMLADKIDENEVLQPKAEKYDQFISASNIQTMNHVAKCLGIGRNKLFKYLRQRNILMSDNVPYQQYINQGYFTARELTVYNGNYSFNTVQTLVTSKGVNFISNIINV